MHNPPWFSEYSSILAQRQLLRDFFQVMRRPSQGEGVAGDFGCRSI
jgi:hypothetical protein